MIQRIDFSPEYQKLLTSVHGTDTRKNLFSDFRWHTLWNTVTKPNGFLLILNFNNSIVGSFIVSDSTASWSGGNDIADYLDLIGPENQKVLAWKEILREIPKYGVMSLDLHNIPADSATIEFFNNIINPDTTIEKEDTTPYIMLPKGWDSYISSLDRHDRHELRRKTKKFETEFPTRIVKITTDINAMNDIIYLMEFDKDKQLFLTDHIRSFFHSLPQVFPSSICMHMLSSKKNIIAGTIGFINHNSFYLYNSGFDPAYPGSGFYLKAQTIKWAIENNISQYNFLQGNERYKYEFGAKDFFVYHVKHMLH